MITQPILDFLIIDTHDPKFLGVADISQFPQGFIVTTPTIEIIPPSFDKSSHVLSVGNLQVYNTNTLNITCVDDYSLLPDLPDGLWNIKISVAPAYKFFKEKGFMRVDSLLHRWQQNLLKTDIKECDQSVRNSEKLLLDEIEWYINGSVAAANVCDYGLATKLYDLAKSLLEDFEKNKRC